MTLTLKTGDHVVMLVGTRGIDARGHQRDYPPGALGVVDHWNDDAEPAGWNVVVGPQDDNAIVITVARPDNILRPLDPLPGQIRAQAVPWSSVVGNGLILRDETGAVIAQLPLRGVGVVNSRAFAEALAARLVDAINFAEGERLARHVKTGGVYRVLGEAGGQDADKSSLASLEGITVTVYRGRDGRMWIRRPTEFGEKFGETQAAQ